MYFLNVDVMYLLNVDMYYYWKDSLNAPTMTRHLAAKRLGVGGRLEVLLGLVKCSARPAAVKTLMFLIFGFFCVDFLSRSCVRPCVRMLF